MLPTLPPHVPPPESSHSMREFLSLRGSRWAITVAVGVGLFWTYPNGAVPGPVPIGPQAPVQQWSTSPDFSFIGRATLGGLPPPDPRQRKAPCDPDTEVEVNGVCWAPLALRPCPRGKAFEHGGQCLMRVLKVVPVPQSGEVRAGNVAGEP